MNPKQSTPKKKWAIRNELTKAERKRVQTKLFCQEWLQVEEYKHWLRNVTTDPTKFKCIACNSILTCGNSELTKHSLGLKYKSNVKGLRGERKTELYYNKALVRANNPYVRQPITVEDKHNQSQN
ncbi:hypothetical protein ACI65C_006308 [Semiaphis heraclei]